MHIFEMPGDERCTDDSETRMSPRCLFVSVTMFIKLDEAAVSVCPEYRRELWLSDTVAIPALRLQLATCGMQLQI
jgi:hypothetical protein